MLDDCIKGSMEVWKEQESRMIVLDLFNYNLMCEDTFCCLVLLVKAHLYFTLKNNFALKLRYMCISNGGIVKGLA